MAQLQPITMKQAKIEISAPLLGIFWTSIKGGKMSHEEVSYNDGAQGLELVFTGLTKLENITLTKPYDPVNDAAIHSFISSQRSAKTAFSVSVTPVNADIAGSPISGGKTIIYNNCTFISYNPPQFDRDGTGLAKVEMVIGLNSLPTF